MDENEFFANLKKMTTGMLPALAYKRIYIAAKEAPQAGGIFVDIGPARGGSTISLLRGIEETGRKTTVYSIDTFCKSNALESWDDIDLNIAVLRDNVEKFAKADKLRIIPATREDPSTAVPQSGIELIFIDADGALDRDFATFYDQLVPGAPVIIDDCELKVSLKYCQMPDKSLAKYVAGKGLETIRDGCPLGKHYTSYRFAKEFEKIGLIELDDKLGNTFFFKRIGNKSYKDAGGPDICSEVRSTILEEFLELRRSVLLLERD